MKKLEGIYLVVDPMMAGDLMGQLAKALEGQLALIQIWNHWGDKENGKKQIIAAIKTEADRYQVPVLLHEDWELALAMQLDGVHFDEVPEHWSHIRSQMADKILGLTVGNDLAKIEWAHGQPFSYLSFCAMFPSTSVATCELVTPEVVQKTRAMTDRPLFLSGGIRPDNLSQLATLDFQGVAVISGIMNAEDPTQAVTRYHQTLKAIKTL